MLCSGECAALTYAAPMVQGKAAIDVLGARLGKSAGALALQLVVLLCGGSILAGAPVVASLFAGVIALWIGGCWCAGVLV